ncbi:MAG: hypothetical protein AAF196_07655, partial [Planctomycetota bacterium]
CPRSSEICRGGQRMNSPDLTGGENPGLTDRLVGGIETRSFEVGMTSGAGDHRDIVRNAWVRFVGDFGPGSRNADSVLEEMARRWPELQPEVDRVLAAGRGES